MYRKDGVKVPDVYARPMALRERHENELGTFPLFSFCGPNTSIDSRRGIADAARFIAGEYHPTVTLAYLTRLQYCVHRHGSDISQIKTDLAEIDQLCKELISYYEANSTQVMLLSEYGISHVEQPVSLNRVLRNKGFITVREELGNEVLDAGASRAFAVADHQLAHIYIDETEDIPKIKKMLEAVDGVATILDEEGKKTHQLDHRRSGELVALAEPGAWFTYY